MSGELAHFSSLDAEVRRGALMLGRASPSVLAKVAGAPELLPVIELTAKIPKDRIPEARALVGWLGLFDATQRGDAESPSVDARPVLRRLHEDPEFARAVGSINPHRAARLVARLPTALVRRVALGLRTAGNEEILDTVVAMLSDLEGWKNVRRLSRVPVEQREALLLFWEKNGALVARVARFLSLPHRLFLAFKVLFGRLFGRR